MAGGGDGIDIIASTIAMITMFEHQFIGIGRRETIPHFNDKLDQVNGKHFFALFPLLGVVIEADRRLSVKFGCFEGGTSRLAEDPQLTKAR